MNRHSSTSLALFCLGAFSMTQVRLIGNIGISEIFVFAAAPFYLFCDYSTLKRDNFATVIWLSLTVCLSCIISCYVNGTYWKSAVRGFASPYALMAWIIVLHHFLRRDFMSFKWLILGLTLTNFINIFAFQTGQGDFGEINGEVGEGAEIVMSNTLFWISRIGAIVRAPISGWYMNVPLGYSFLALVGLAVYSLLTSSSGRAVALVTIGGAFLVAWGGKSRRRMRSIKKHFIVFVACAIVGGTMCKMIYSSLARDGVLGEDARAKYERQTRMGDSTMQLLIAGRMEFFVCLMAAVDKPIFGHGPWALDEDGYYRRYLSEYGTLEDYKGYEQQILRNGGERLHMISAHSHILGWWVWYGLMGAVFWAYVLWLLFELFRKYIDAIPQWFGYFSFAVPSMIWAIFFSPFSGRLAAGLLITCVLFARAIATNKLRLPSEMQLEAQKHDKS